MSLIDSYSDEEFFEIVKKSFTYKDCLKQMGYNSTSGANTNLVKKRIEKNDLDISHFHRVERIFRKNEDIFVKDSEVCQRVLRAKYLQGNFTPYKCSICGLEPIWQNKPLTLILDHVNGYNHDNRLKNLRWVCPNCNYQLETTNGKNINHGQHKVNYCIDCGKPISNKSFRCVQCENYKKKKAPKISREELKRLIYDTPFTKIGEKYKVSDNTIRKWCAFYNLPKTVKEIKKYSKIQWLNI